MRARGESAHDEVVCHVAVRVAADHKEHETDTLQGERDEAQKARHGAEAAEEVGVVHLWPYTTRWTWYQNQKENDSERRKQRTDGIQVRGHRSITIAGLISRTYLCRFNEAGLRS